MSKRKLPEDFMGSFLSGKPAAAADQVSPDNRSEPRTNSYELAQGEQTRVNFWLPVSWKKALAAHFKGQGIDLSSGIRQALARYMSEEGLR